MGPVIFETDRSHRLGLAAQVCDTASGLGHVTQLYSTVHLPPELPAQVPSARARLHLDGLDDSLDAAQSLEGLESYSHVWLVWLAHLNGHEATNSKVAAPHLRGKRTGLFATRSPYRPNPIGLTLARLDRVERETVHLSGVDLVHGTPILDIKPHIPSYDQPDTSDALGRPASTDGDSEDGSQPRIAAWTDPPPLDVSLAPAAAQWLDSLAPSGERLLPDADVLQACLCECLSGPQTLGRSTVGGGSGRARRPSTCCASMASRRGADSQRTRRGAAA